MFICSANLSLIEDFWFLVQDCVLFHDTIEYNLHYGDLTKDVADVQRVARITQLHDAITSWAKGYNTQVNQTVHVLQHSELDSAVVS